MWQNRLIVAAIVAVVVIAAIDALRPTSRDTAFSMGLGSYGPGLVCRICAMPRKTPAIAEPSRLRMVGRFVAIPCGLSSRVAIVRDPLVGAQERAAARFLSLPSTAGPTMIGTSGTGGIARPAIRCDRKDGACECS